MRETFNEPMRKMNLRTVFAGLRKRQSRHQISVAGAANLAQRNGAAASRLMVVIGRLMLRARIEVIRTRQEHRKTGLGREL